jgi:N-acetylglutamate synthase-like GNAT family acetyltransferase
MQQVSPALFKLDSPLRPDRCLLRPAQRSDRAKIAALTRQLHRTAVPHPSWHYWVGGGLVGLLVVVVWHYPTIATAVILSTTPLWVAIGLAFVLADQEQQRNWDQYWVLEYEQALVACGRLDIHRDHSEIYDLFVVPEWRQHGIGRALMNQLIQQARFPIYLASLSNATGFYQRLGFYPIAAQGLPVFLAGRLSLNSPRYRRVGLQAMIMPHNNLI